MTLDQINELINRGVVGVILAVVGLMLLYYLFDKDSASPQERLPNSKN